MTYYPGGDPTGPSDGYPGSIFGIGHDWHYYVSEISIPIPIISDNLDELNTATTLQGFQDITGGIFDGVYFEIRYGDIEYLPPQGVQESAKLHAVWGQHFEDGDNPTHFWCEVDLSNAQTAGPWYFGNYTPYVTNDYLFEIPQEWAAANTPNKLLAGGRFREGEWGGRGPALFAYGPWNDGNPPSARSTLISMTPLLLYGINISRTQAVTTSSDMQMDNFNETDEWTGGAWLTASTNSAVVFVGTKGIGNAWYGFADGTVWPDEPPYPPVPPPPNDDRGWWAENYERQIIFFDPAHLAAVAWGTMQTYEPQPYASLNIDPYLHNVDSSLPRYAQEGHLGAACFDRARGILYVFQRLADGEKSIVHVWAVGSGESTSIYVSPDGGCGGNIPCYSTIQPAIDAAANGTTIMIAQGTYNEDLSLGSSKDLKLQGGWDSSFTARSLSSTVKSITISNSEGTVTLEYLVIE